MFYIYILKSKKDNKLYTGYTSNLEKRIKQHRNGEVSSTKQRRPLDLIYYEAYKSEKDAKAREKYLKTTQGKQRLKKQLVNVMPVKLR